MAFGNFKNSTCLSIMLIVFMGCAPFHAIPPQGFAKYKGKKSTYRAVSPNGVVYRVRTVKNKPYAELPFWKEAVQTRMENAGYSFVNASDISHGKTKGALLELAAPLGAEDYSYIVAIFQKRKRIVVVETSGEVNSFQARKPQIVEAIKKIEF